MRALLTVVTVVGAGLVAGQPALAESARFCTAGARTLSRLGDHVYPETGNGGYRSLHTAVHLTYDANTNRFLPGNHVVLTDRATQCLSQFSLDFERSSINTSAGPDMRVTKVVVDGRPARFSFARPTYPGDPHGPDDPDPRAHQMSQHNPVGGPHHNPLPPACSPVLTNGSDQPDSRDGDLCPATKLVITPTQSIENGSPFTVRVDYVGRPGVHNSSDGTTDGWFRSNKPRGDGGFVMTEPIGSQAWMPLNNHPSAKPTYDFYDTVTPGRTAIANGVLEWSRRNKANAEFPHGSVTWHWHAAEPIASYLVENSVGHYILTKHGRYYQAQAAAIDPAQRRENRALMTKQAEITEFESRFTGPYPFRSAGSIVGLPDTGTDEEEATMIAFSGGALDEDTLYHENMHQWWGDNVSESNYDMTFFTEGAATLAEFLYKARRAGPAKFEESLTRTFNHGYAHTDWSQAPSNPTPYGLFSGDATYNRPGLAYLALRRIIGPGAFVRSLKRIQRQYGGRTITEPQLETVFRGHVPKSCSRRLDAFFTQWFDTASRKPAITDRNFYRGSCSR